jgi:putative N6-adenine-specific DNA methylase
MTKKIFPLLAKTVSGLEELLAFEIQQLGGQNVQVLKRAVWFEGDKETMYRMNYRSRLALRILKPMLSFEVNEQEDLYSEVNKVHWEDIISANNSIAIDSVIGESVFSNSQFVSYRTKDAIIDRFRSVSGDRPSIDLDNPDLRINVHIFKQSCTISLDSSGRSLHKRGYRISAGIAPLNEVLAAGMIQLSGWDKKTPFVDFMCGSATLLMEAAMLADSIPPGYFKPDFGFMKWKDYDPEMWHAIKEGEDEKIAPSNTVITGCDNFQKAVDSAMQNIRFAKMSNRIKVECCSFEHFTPPEENGFVVTNPPYDERLQMDDIIAFYKKTGDVLKKKYTGYEAWVISSDLRALKFIGLHPSKKITVFNGPLECRFVRFTLY